MPDEQPITILLIEDEPAHAEIVRRNFESIGIANMLQHVSDGEAALDFGEVGMIVLLSPPALFKTGDSHCDQIIDKGGRRSR
jgi:hypothetical protein